MIGYLKKVVFLLIIFEVSCIYGILNNGDHFPISFLDCRGSSVLGQIPTSQKELIMYSSDPEVYLNIPNEALRYNLSSFGNDHLAFFNEYSGVIKHDSINGVRLVPQLLHQFRQLYTTRHFTETSDYLPACGGCIYHAFIDNGSASYICPGDIDITVEDDCTLAQYHIDWVEPYLVNSNGEFATRTDIERSGGAPGDGFVPGIHKITYRSTENSADHFTDCSFSIRIMASCQTILNLTTPAGIMGFNKTVVGSSSSSNKIRCPQFSGAGNMPRAIATCNYNHERGPYWQEPVIADCLAGLTIKERVAIINTELDKFLARSTSVPTEEVIEVALAIDEISKMSSEDESEYIIEEVGKLLNKLIKLNDSSDEVTNIVLSVANNFIEEDIIDLDDEDEIESADLGRIVISLEAQARNQIVSGRNFTGIENNIALLNRVVNGSASNVSLSFANFKVNMGDSDRVVIEDFDRLNLTVISGQVSTANINIITSVSLPNNTRSYVKEGHPLAVSFLLYKNGALFGRPSQSVGELASFVRQEVGSQVVAATVYDLRTQSPIFSDDDPVITSFAPIQVVSGGETELDRICVFWNFTNDGFWSTDGCSMDTTQMLSSRVVCRCNHATSFAVLVNIEEQHVIFSWISQLGCAVSAFALLFTIISVLSIRKVRSKTPYKVHVSLMVSLLALYVIFLFGVDRTESNMQCIAISAGLHYFLLTSFMWMLMEAILVYRTIVITTPNASEPRFIWYSSFIAWVLPIIPVAAPFVMDLIFSEFAMTDFYQLDTYCFLKADSIMMYAGLLGIMSVILAVNVLITILLFIRLCRPMEFITPDRRKYIITFISITFIFGLTWGVGFFAIRDATFYVSIAFSVLNGFQGFFIFLTFGVRQNEVRRLWASPFFFLSNRGSRATKSTSKLPDISDRQKGQVNRSFEKSDNTL